MDKKALPMKNRSQNNDHNLEFDHLREIYTNAKRDLSSEKADIVHNRDRGIPFVSDLIRLNEIEESEKKMEKIDYALPLLKHLVDKRLLVNEITTQNDLLREIKNDIDFDNPRKWSDPLTKNDFLETIVGQNITSALERRFFRFAKKNNQCIHKLSKDKYIYKKGWGPKIKKALGY